MCEYSSISQECHISGICSIEGRFLRHYRTCIRGKISRHSPSSLPLSLNFIHALPTPSLRCGSHFMVWICSSLPTSKASWSRCQPQGEEGPSNSRGPGYRRRGRKKDPGRSQPGSSPAPAHSSQSCHYSRCGISWGRIALLWRLKHSMPERHGCRHADFAARCN